MRFPPGVLVLAILASAGGPASAATVGIVAFGDSWTTGRYLDNPQQAYPAQLESLLKAKGDDVAIRKAGEDGDRTATALARVDTAVPPGTKIALVEFGPNDTRAIGRESPVDPAVTKANLDTLLGKLQARGILVLLIGAKGLDYSDVAARDGVDYEQWPILGSSDIAGDGQHPNADGYKILVAHMLPAVESLIARVKSGR
ncbi:MAG: GDSL-type esterase/lipase family protein [Stellaceae bacterium]|jgi:acyl-CoA thioesterase I